MSLRACRDVSAASWIVNSDADWQRLVTFGPPVFGAYARLRYLPDPSYAGQSEADADDDERPGEHDMLRAALDILVRFTRTPDDYYFCLWDGWGPVIDGDEYQRIPPAFDRSTLRGPKVVVPYRSYYLFRGALSEFGAWPTTDPSWSDDVPDPALMWPADRAWCIANDVDPHYAGIGADADAIDELLAQSDLDIVAADPDAVQPSYD